jgi:thymidylate synthase
MLGGAESKGASGANGGKGEGGCWKYVRAVREYGGMTDYVRSLPDGSAGMDAAAKSGRYAGRMDRANQSIDSKGNGIIEFELADQPDLAAPIRAHSLDDALAICAHLNSPTPSPPVPSPPAGCTPTAPTAAAAAAAAASISPPHARSAATDAVTALEESENALRIRPAAADSTKGEIKHLSVCTRPLLCFAAPVCLSLVPHPPDPPARDMQDLNVLATIRSAGASGGAANAAGASLDRGNGGGDGGDVAGVGAGGGAGGGNTKSNDGKSGGEVARATCAVAELRVFVIGGAGLLGESFGHPRLERIIHSRFGGRASADVHFLYAIPRWFRIQSTELRRSSATILAPSSPTSFSTTAASSRSLSGARPAGAAVAGRAVLQRDGSNSGMVADDTWPRAAGVLDVLKTLCGNPVTGAAAPALDPPRRRGSVLSEKERKLLASQQVETGRTAAVVGSTMAGAGGQEGRVVVDVERQVWIRERPGTAEHRFRKVLRKVLAEGIMQVDRTGVGTMSRFGDSFRFDLRDGFPLLTGARKPWQCVVAELLWMLRGETHIAALHKDSTRIWDANAESKVVKDLKMPPGELGPIYGRQWRAFGPYEPYQTHPLTSPDSAASADSAASGPPEACKPYQTRPLTGQSAASAASDRPEGCKPCQTRPLTGQSAASGGTEAGAAQPLFAAGAAETVDQIRGAIDELRRSPSSRRNVVTAWNPLVLNRIALPACHCLFQLKVVNGRLHLLVLMRSNDLFLGAPFNIASYALLNHILATMTGLEPGEIIYMLGDAHIYQNHIDKVRLMLERPVRIPPTLEMDLAPIHAVYPPNSTAPPNFGLLTTKHFRLRNYHPHPTIRAPMAV